MSRLVWVLAWVAVAIWSLVAWGTYGLVELFGEDYLAYRRTTGAFIPGIGKKA